jgi:hypothetical protein
MSAALELKDFTDYKIADLSLADWDRKEMTIAGIKVTKTIRQYWSAVRSRLTN